MTETTFSIEGEQEVIAHIKVLSRRASAPGPSLWNSIGSYLRGAFKQQFSTQGAYLGRPWKPLKPSYAAWKNKMGRGARGILVFDGGLRDSYIRKVQAVQRTEGPTAAVFGSSNRLAPYHQFGTHSHHTGKPILPARPVIVRTPKLNSDIASIVSRYVMGKQQDSSDGGDE